MVIEGEPHYDAGRSDDEVDDIEKLRTIGLTPKDIEELRVLSGGTTSVILDIPGGPRPMVMKRGFHNDPHEGARREYAVLRLLRRRSGEKVSPNPYYYNEARDLLVMEKIDGRTIEQLDDTAIEKIADALSLVHRPEFTKPGIPFHPRHEATQYERLKEQLRFLQNWLDDMSGFIPDEHQRDALQQIINVFSARAEAAESSFRESSFSLIHYDLNPGNIVQGSDGSVLFLDWRQASIGDRAMDIAKLFTKCGFKPDQAETFFRRYQLTDSDKSIRERTAAYAPLVKISSLLWRLRFLNVDIQQHPEVIENVNLDRIRKLYQEDFDYLLDQAGLHIERFNQNDDRN